MVILETAASKAAGSGAYRSSKGNGFAKNVSLIFVCVLPSRVPWYLAARDLHATNNQEPRTDDLFS